MAARKGHCQHTPKCPRFTCVDCKRRVQACGGSTHDPDVCVDCWNAHHARVPAPRKRNPPKKRYRSVHDPLPLPDDCMCGHSKVSHAPDQQGKVVPLAWAPCFAHHCGCSNYIPRSHPDARRFWEITQEHAEKMRKREKNPARKREHTPTCEKSVAKKKSFRCYDCGRPTCDCIGEYRDDDTNVLVCEECNKIASKFLPKIAPEITEQSGDYCVCHHARADHRIDGAGDAIECKKCGAVKCPEYMSVMYPGGAKIHAGWAKKAKHGAEMSKLTPMGRLSKFVRAYIHQALDFAKDPEGDDVDLGYTDLPPDIAARLISDAEAFEEHHADDLDEALQIKGYTMERAGGDFYLSRNGHGAGFFDNGTQPVWNRLQKAAKIYGTFELVVDPDSGDVYVLE